MKNDRPVYLNTDLSPEERARDLVMRMTLSEKISQMTHDAPAIERLGIPEYNWWNECLHGVARAGVATVFPQAIGMAATWNTELIHRVAGVISDEARAKHHEALRLGDHGMYKGLTYWSPNINILRDPRWGRGHETYGEDPYLTSRMAVAFVTGLQGAHPKYRKLDATAKHFAVHSGPEKHRHGFNAVVSQHDLHDTYLPAFKACVREARVAAVMGAYNRVNGEPCCASRTLLGDVLRDEWGFDGYVVSDCGAIDDIHAHHGVTHCSDESAALSVENGCDLNCGCTYPKLLSAVQKGLITQDPIDHALVRLFTARFRLGMFDPPENVPFAQIPYEANDCEKHRQLALRTARESIVLLKNEGGLLPLAKDLRSVAVIGPNADNPDALIGNYSGTPSKLVSPLAGIREAVSPETRVVCAQGCDLFAEIPVHLGGPKQFFTEAISAAERADAIIMCLGLSPSLEGEEGDAFNSDASGDRTEIGLPRRQEELLRLIRGLGKPVVLVMLNGNAVAIDWAQKNVPAILEAWYPGEEGGSAIADVIFGDYNPAGRLPATSVRSLDDLPPFEDYSMQGRTYRYLETEPLYPFGFGLSYTSLEYLLP